MQENSPIVLDSGRGLASSTGRLIGYDGNKRDGECECECECAIKRADGGWRKREGRTGDGILYLNALGFASGSKHDTHFGTFVSLVGRAPTMPGF